MVTANSLSQTPLALLSRLTAPAPVRVAKSFRDSQPSPFSTLMNNLRSGLAARVNMLVSRSTTRRVYALLVIGTTASQSGNAAGLPSAKRAEVFTPVGLHSVDVASGLWVNTSPRACEKEVPGKSPLQVALRHYVKGADPIPRRFLTVVGSDSALPEMGTKVLAEYGPTYYWAGSEKSKADLREKLERVGPYPALLVVIRGNTKVNATTQSIRLGGHYVTGEFHGKVATSRQYSVTCGAAGWVIKDTKEEPAK